MLDGVRPIGEMTAMKPSTSVDPGRDLSQTEAWFRDTLLKVLAWSGAVILLLAGWTLHGEEEFSLSTCRCSSFGDNTCQRALGLAFGYPLLLLTWILLVWWVRERCPEHSTVPSKLVVYGYVFVMTILSLVLLALLLD